MKKRSTTQHQIDQLLDEAEARGVCVRPDSEAVRNALRRRLAGGEVVQPLPRLFVRSSHWAELDRAEKYLHVVRTDASHHITWVFSHATAAVVYGLDVSHRLLWPVHYYTDELGGGVATQRCYRHHRVIGYNPFKELGGIKVTDPLQTVVDCACTYPFAEALAIADSALHKGLLSKEDLVDGLRWFPGRRGIVGARRVCDLADSRPESGGESLVRALMFELGLPLPELQVPIPNLCGPGGDYRADFVFRPQDLPPVVFELDGLEKYRNIEMTRGRLAVQVMAAERQREAQITASGFRVARLGFAQAMNPSVLLGTLAAYGVVPEGRSAAA